MKITNLFPKWKATMNENKWHRIVNGGLVLIVGILVLDKVTAAPDKILAPPHLTKDMHVSKSGKSEEFSIMWGLSFSELLGNLDPDNADEVKNDIGPFLDPGIYNEAMAEMSDEIQNLKDDRVSQTFQAAGKLYESETNKVFFFGTAERKGNAGKVDRRQRTYEFQIVSKNYSPVLVGVASYFGPPRTLKEAQRLDLLRKQEEERKQAQIQAENDRRKEDQQ
jgi:conjugal transfer pilus assembly protein TraE